MLINETYSDLPDSQCKRCRNYDICNLKEKVAKVNIDISNVHGIIDIPIIINVGCKKYIKRL